MKITKNIVKRLVFLCIGFYVVIALFWRCTHFSNRVTENDFLQLKELISCNETLSPYGTTFLELERYYSDQMLIDRLSNCLSYFNDVTLHGLKVRSDLKIAFSHQIHEQISLYETFLRLYFHPKNYYCIHLDAKASREIKKALYDLVNCYQLRFGLNTIFVVNNPIEVYWGHYSVLEADLKCLKELYDRFKDWSYYMNWAGTELPLVTLSDLYNYMKTLNGKSLMSSQPFNLLKMTNDTISIDKGKRSSKRIATKNKLIRSRSQNLFKGYKNVILSHNQTEFVLEDWRVCKFKEWLKDKIFPEEYFFHTLKKLDPKEEKLDDLANERCLRFTYWTKFSQNYDWKCNGTERNEICQFSVWDLPHVYETKCLVANKFNINDPQSVLCLTKHIIENQETF